MWHPVFMCHCISSMWVISSMCHHRVLGLLCVSKVELIWRMKGQASWGALLPQLWRVMKYMSLHRRTQSWIQKNRCYWYTMAYQNYPCMIILRDFHYEILIVFWMFLNVEIVLFSFLYTDLFLTWFPYKLIEYWARDWWVQTFFPCRNDPNGLKPSTSIYTHIFSSLSTPQKICWCWARCFGFMSSSRLRIAQHVCGIWHNGRAVVGTILTPLVGCQGVTSTLVFVGFNTVQPTAILLK